MVVEWGQAQAAVIGSGLIDAGCVPLILAELRPEDFTGAYLRFYEAFRDLTAEQAPIDPVIVLSRIGQEYRDTAKGIMDATPTSANVQAYIKACKEQSRLRLLRDLGEELAAAQTLDDARPLMQKAAELTLEKVRQPRKTAMEMAADWINKINSREKPDLFLTGIGCIDSVVHTVRGNYHILAGYPSHGKSALALRIAWNMAADRKVAYFSNEMPYAEFLDRSQAVVSDIDAERAKLNELTEEEIQASGRTASEWFQLRDRVTYEPATRLTVDDIRTRVLQYGYDVIFVDYLQLIRSSARFESKRYNQVSEISTSLRDMAMDLNIVVFAVSQLSRPDDDKGWIAVPTVSDLRESGQLEQDADAVIFIHAPLRLQFPRFRVLEVGKNRTGRIGRFFMDFRGGHMQFGAPTVLDSKIWAEMMRKRRALSKEEREAIEEEHKTQAEADVKRALEREQRKRHEAERRGGEQTVMEEVKD